ncbi:unnamed protein product [Closterium sp. NIES-54]
MRYAARDLLQAAYRSLRQPSVPTPSARAALPCRLALSPALGGAVGGGVRGASGGVGSGVLPAAAAVLCYQPRQQQHHQHHQHHQHCPSHHNQLHYTAQCSQSHVVARSSSSSSSFSSSPSSFSPSFSSHPIFSPAAASAAAPADLLSSHARQSPGPLLPHSPPHSPPHFPPHRPAAMATQAPRGPVQTQPPRGPVHMQQQVRVGVLHWHLEGSTRRGSGEERIPVWFGGSTKGVLKGFGWIHSSLPSPLPYCQLPSPSLHFPFPPLPSHFPLTPGSSARVSAKAGIDRQPALLTL